MYFTLQCVDNLGVGVLCVMLVESSCLCSRMQELLASKALMPL